MAADDSVHVFVPEFPDLSKYREKLRIKASEGQYSGIPLPDDTISDDEDEASWSEPKGFTRQTFRAQYSEGSKHMPVSYPPLDPRVNRELFQAANMPFPYEGAVEAPDDDHSEGSSSDSDYESDAGAGDEEGEGGGASLGFNRPFGAGYGPITGVGSSMNHVVSLAWSPSGLGVNRRPILGVLTGSGTLAVYGDGNEFANILPRANEGMLQRRELNSWIVLWGVGERLIVPGQQTKVSEYIRAFAWAKEIGPGQGLLATLNDQKEVAIISVQRVFVEDDAMASKGEFTVQPRENAVWLVREIVRFKAEGPHEEPNVSHHSFLPSGCTGTD